MNVISLFSGAGGLDLGFIQAGHEIIWANDHDPDAVMTYQKNIGRHIIAEDIENIKVKDIPKADILIGGFPCQGFSCANLKRSTEDKRNELYLQFLKVLSAKQPKYFLAENVRGLLSLDKGRVLQMIISDFETCGVGYKVSYKVLNAADFGVPQHRLRVIIVGVRNDLAKKQQYNFPKPTHLKLNENGDRNLFEGDEISSNGKVGNWITILQALEKIPEPTESHELLNHVCSKYKITNRNFTGHRTTDPNKPSPTILARGNGKGGVCAIQHPKNHRRLSVRESAIIQTFPIDFEFCGTLGSMYRQVGNAVPVLLAKRLAESFTEMENNE